MLRAVSPTPLPTTLPGGRDALDSAPATPGRHPSGVQPVDITNAATSAIPPAGSGSPPPPSRRVVWVSPLALGGGTLTICADDSARPTASPAGVFEWQTGATPLPSASPSPAAVRSGEALTAAWQDMLQAWTERIADGLHARAATVMDGLPGLPDRAHYQKVATGMLGRDLETLVASEELRPYLPLCEPLPQRLCDQVREAAQLEMPSIDASADEQTAWANHRALNDICIQLQEPAAQVLIDAPLGRLFAALHARARNG